MKITMRFLLVAVFSIIAMGCATLDGNITYINPDNSPALNNYIVIDSGKNEVWRHIIPELAKQFFFVYNFDKDSGIISGIINESYNGDLEKYIDCGWITSNVKVLGDEHTYKFPASRANQDYAIVSGRFYAAVNRKMNLESRMNIVVEEIRDNQSKITVDTRYIITKTTIMYPYDTVSSLINPRFSPSNQFIKQNDSIEFNSGQESAFPEGTRCKATGEFETNVLSFLTQSLNVHNNKTTKKLKKEKEQDELRKSGIIIKNE